jgi:2-dehydro-3-deoxygluconokinase
VSEPVFDVVTLGETMIRLTPPNMLRWEQTKSLDIDVGGSESNTAVGLARLGLRTAWISRLPNHDFGRMVAREIGGHGVDVGYVTWCETDRLGVYFYEEASPPRNARVIYDRRDSAFARMKPSDLSQALFQPGRARCLHVTGISMAVSADAARTTAHAVELARDCKWLVSFDVNYRSKLWSPKEAEAACRGVMERSDVLLLPRRDATGIFGVPEHLSPEEALVRLQSQFPQAKTIAMTLGAEGAVAIDQGVVRLKSIVPVEQVGRLGGGDAFTAGYLFGFLEGYDVGTRLAWANAAAMLKYSIRGDLPRFSKSEVQAIVERLQGCGEVAPASSVQR